MPSASGREAKAARAALAASVEGRERWGGQYGSGYATFAVRADTSPGAKREALNTAVERAAEAVRESRTVVAS
jgi:hypothetical protein